MNVSNQALMLLCLCYPKTQGNDLGFIGKKKKIRAISKAENTVTYNFCFKVYTIQILALIR